MTIQTIGHTPSTTLPTTDKRTAQVLDQLVEDFLDHSSMVDTTGAAMHMTPRLRPLYRVLGGLREIQRSAAMGLDDEARRHSADVLEAVAALLRTA